MNKKILLVEDNAKVQLFNKSMLEEEGFEVKSALTLEQAKEEFEKFNPDVVVLDVGMPDGSGLSFLKLIRQKSNLPVLMLTGFSRDEDVVAGFSAGCDDYLAKPYSFDVLLVRIRHMLRSYELSKNILKAGPITIDIFLGTASIGSEELVLTPKDFALLRMFVQYQGETISGSDIYSRVWGQPMNDNNKALASGISRLRKKLTGSGYGIISIYGGGYLFDRE